MNRASEARAATNALLATGAGAAGLAVATLATTSGTMAALAAALACAASAFAARGLVLRTSERTAPAPSAETDDTHRARAREESERVLRFVVEEAPSAVVFLASTGRVLLANAMAREVFFDGHDLVGKNFLGMLSRAPEALRRAMAAEGDEILSVEDADGEPKTFHLGKRHLVMNGEPVVLVVLHDLTRGIGRREVEVWKQVIRVIAHEVNNSLAPISTLATTGHAVVRGTELEETLSVVFETVSERATHLSTFLEGYARFARLPPPDRRVVRLRDISSRMTTLWPGISVEGDLDAADGWFDPAQAEQLLLNLLKNASESGSAPEDITLFVDGSSVHDVKLAVRDRGRGMTPEVMKRALLPLFSTKAGGRGVGLALCREIADAHGGTLRLSARDGGGTEVVVRFPRRAEAGRDEHGSVLSLSRAE